MKKIKILLLCIIVSLYGGSVNAGSSGSEDISKTNSNSSTKDCFEGLNRAFFQFNYGLDKTVFEPVAKGYRHLPSPIRRGTSNVIDNLRSLLTFSNNVLQGDFSSAGNTVARFAINSTVGILGIWDPASKMGIDEKTREDFGQTLGVWGVNSGCYLVLPIIGPSTTRDFVGTVGNFFLDPVYQITHNTEVQNRSFSEHNYYYYRGTNAIDFRAKNIESFDSIEKNSMDLYSSVKSLYLQNREQRINNTRETTETLDDSDWEEIETK